MSEFSVSEKELRDRADHFEALAKVARKCHVAARWRWMAAVFRDEAAAAATEAEGSRRGLAPSDPPVTTRAARAAVPRAR